MNRVETEQVDLFDKAWDLLKSSKYPCPGGHYEKGLSASVVEDMATEANVDPDDVLMTSWADKPKWIQEGECREQLEIYLDSEGGEYGPAYSYIVVEESDCAMALGFTNEDDSFYTHPGQVFGMYRERKRLENAFHEMARQVKIKRIKDDQP